MQSTAYFLSVGKVLMEASRRSKAAPEETALPTEAEDQPFSSSSDSCLKLFQSMMAYHLLISGS
jgi:hypothetical protein